MPGAFGENFPYTNFHELNMDWIVKIAKDFLDQYTSITDLVNSGKEELTQLSQEELQALEAKADEIEALLDSWYETHSADIANALAAALADFNVQATRKAQETIASIPSDYTTLSNLVENEALLVKNAYTTYASLPEAYRDCDNLPINTVQTLTFGVTTEQQQTMLHYPTQPFTGEIITINGVKNNSAWGAQIAFSAAQTQTGLNNRIYMRTRYSSWNDWKELASISELRNAIEQNSIYVYDAYTSYALLPTAYRDANALPVNTVIGYKFGWTDEQAATMHNFPTTPFGGELLTLNTTKSNQSFGFQMAISEATGAAGLHGRIFVRFRYTHWSSWIEIANPTYQTGGFRGLGSFVACGDSLTVSMSYKNSTTYKNVKSWALYLADMMGSSANVYAQGGITTGLYLNSALMTSAQNDVSDFAILFLGTNDANQQVNVNTFKSNYTSIINNLLVNHGYVFCMTLPAATSPSNRATYNAAIKEVVASVSKAFLIDIEPYNNMIANFVSNGHLNSCGYAALANAVSMAMNNLIVTSAFTVNPDFPN